MPKNTEPVMGTHLNSALSIFAERMTEKANDELKVGEMAKQSAVVSRMTWDLTQQLIDAMNGDICATKRQIKLVALLLKRDAGKVIEEQKNVDRATRDLAVLCNSFRLECINCLNEDCEMRDPKQPVPNQ